MNLSQGHDTPLGHGKQLYEILSRSNMTKWSYGPDTILGTSMCALWSWPWRYDIGSRSCHTLGHGQSLCEILTTSNSAVGSYGPDMDFRYVYTVTLTLEIWHKVNVITHPWVMVNNCGKYYPDRTKWLIWSYGGTHCEQTGRQTDERTDRVQFIAINILLQLFNVPIR